MAPFTHHDALEWISTRDLHPAERVRAMPLSNERLLGVVRHSSEHVLVIWKTVDGNQSAGHVRNVTLERVYSGGHKWAVTEVHVLPCPEPLTSRTGGYTEGLEGLAAPR